MKLNGKDREDGQYVKVLQAKKTYKDTVTLVSTDQRKQGYKIPKKEKQLESIKQKVILWGKKHLDKLIKNFLKS